AFAERIGVPHFSPFLREVGSQSTPHSSPSPAGFCRKIGVPHFFPYLREVGSQSTPHSSPSPAGFCRKNRGAPFLAVFARSGKPIHPTFLACDDERFAMTSGNVLHAYPPAGGRNSS